MEDKTHVTIQSNLSKTSSYLLGLAEVKGNTLEQEMLMHLNSKYTHNQIKKIVKTADYIIDTLNAVFKDLQINRVYSVIKRVSKSFSSICSHLIQTLEKYQLSSNTSHLNPTQPTCKSERVNQVDELQEVKMELKLKRMRGICLYNQNYKRNIDSEGRNQEAENIKKKKIEQEQQQQVDEKQFKRRLFNKLKKQLNEVEQELYCPSPDEMTTFIIFQRKFIESFNHLSHAESLEVIAEYLESSKISAVQLLNQQEDMTESIAKFKAEIDLLIKDAKRINNQRNHTISDKFQSILSRFLKKRQQLFASTKQKLNLYRKMVEDKEGKRVSIGIETNIKQLGTLKGFERKVFELEQKYKVKDQEKNRAYRAMLEKSDYQMSILHSEITKYKIANKTLTDDILQAKKQHTKILEKLYQKRNQSKDQRNQGKSEKFLNKKSESKIEMGEADENTSQVEKDKDKKLIRQSQLYKKEEKLEIEKGQVVSPQIRPKNSKVVSIKQIENDQKTKTAIQYEELSNGSSKKSRGKTKSIKNNTLASRNELMTGENEKISKNEFKKFKSSSVLNEDKRTQILAKASTLKVIKSYSNQKNEKNQELQPNEQSGKRGRNYLRFKTQQIVEISEKSIHKQNEKINSSANAKMKEKKRTILTFHESNQIVEKSETLSAHKIISEIEIKNKSVPKQEKKVETNIRKPTKYIREHPQQYARHRDWAIERKNQSNIKLSQKQAYSFCYNGNSMELQEKEEMTNSGMENNDQEYVRRVVRHNRNQIVKEILLKEQQKLQKSNKDIGYFSKQAPLLKHKKYQSNSLYLTNQEKQQNDYELNNSVSVLRVKSLFKDNPAELDKNDKPLKVGENLIFKKKLMKHLQSMEWLNRKKYQPFRLNHESLNENSIFHERIKLKENDKLKKIKKKREQFESLYRKKSYGNKDQSEAKLPGIKAKAIF